MPNPIKESVPIVGPLSDHHFSLLGKIAAAWVKVEMEIALIVASESAAKIRSVLFTFENMPTRAKINAAAAILQVEGFEAVRREFLPLLEAAKKLASIRHLAVHSNWLGVTKYGALVAMDVDATIERVGVGRKCWTEAELVTAISGLHDLASAMKQVRHECGTVPTGDFS
jgi:hypothetical protein